LGISAYGFYNARHLKVTHYDVTIDAPNFEDQSLRVALMADFHLGVNSSLNHFKRMVEATNESEPDIILIAGDIFNSTYSGISDPDAYIEVLSQLKAPMGVYAVYGNHDNAEPLLCGFPMASLKHNKRPDIMNEFMEKAGITVLNDEVVRFNDHGFTLIGRQSVSKTGDGDTPRASVDEMFKGLDQNDALIVLQHEPAELKALAAAGADLALMGHTHDGQFFPGNVFSRMTSPLCYGYKLIDGSLNGITTSGVGFYGPPIRVGTISEVAIIDLTSNTTTMNNC